MQTLKLWCFDFLLCLFVLLSCLRVLFQRKKASFSGLKITIHYQAFTKQRKRKIKQRFTELFLDFSKFFLCLAKTDIYRIRSFETKCCFILQKRKFFVSLLFVFHGIVQTKSNETLRKNRTKTCFQANSARG